MATPYPNFATVRAEWLRARAALVQFESDDSTDETMTAAIEACRAAEWKMLQTPAKDLTDIRTRAQVVLEMFAIAEIEGEPTDNRHRLMLAALVSEILSPQCEAQAG
jgi:hypothetical protein